MNRRFQKSVTSTILILLTCNGYGQAVMTGQQPPVNQIQTPDTTASILEYRLGPGDVLHVSVWKNEDLSRTVTIRPDGKISLPLIGEIYVVGSTPAEVQASLVEKMDEYVDGAARNVFVIVEQVNSYQVSVMGEVNKPGRYKIQGSTMVLDVLSEAGGLTEFASESMIVIFRRVGNGMTRIPFNYRELVAGKRDQDLVFVQPGDIVLVP